MTISLKLLEIQEDAEIRHGLHNNSTGMADTASVHVGMGTTSVWAGMWAAETINAKVMQPLAFYMPEETKLLEDYYGMPLAFLLGIDFMWNAECRPFFTDLCEIA